MEVMHFVNESLCNVSGIKHHGGHKIKDRVDRYSDINYGCDVISILISNYPLQ